MLDTILAAAAAATITFTIPTTGQLRTVDPSLGSDSVRVECLGGPAVGVDSTKLYGWVWGIPHRPDDPMPFLRSHYVRGSASPQDTFTVGPGLYDIRAKNGAGEGCATDPITVRPDSSATGVPIEETGQARPRWLVFDVRGRLLLELEGGTVNAGRLRRTELATGIYFVRRRERPKEPARKVLLIR